MSERYPARAMRAPSPLRAARACLLSLGLCLCALAITVAPVDARLPGPPPGHTGGDLWAASSAGGTAAPDGAAAGGPLAIPTLSAPLLDFGSVTPLSADPATGGVAAPGPSSAAPRTSAEPLFAAQGSAAALHTDLPCYLADRVVALSGIGLPPGTTYTVALDGRPQGGGRVNSQGGLTGRLLSGAAPSGGELQRSVTVRGAAGRLSASFAVTRFDAGFSPAVGNPNRLLVRFSALGFGLGPVAARGTVRAPAPRAVYVHYLDPGGRDRADVLLGHTTGACGSLVASPLVRLFPFSPSRGTWRLQIDTSAGYSRASAPRLLRAVLVA